MKKKRRHFITVGNHAIAEDTLLALLNDLCVLEVSTNSVYYKKDSNNNIIWVLKKDKNES